MKSAIVVIVFVNVVTCFAVEFDWIPPEVMEADMTRTQGRLDDKLRRLRELEQHPPELLEDMDMTEEEHNDAIAIVEMLESITLSNNDDLRVLTLDSKQSCEEALREARTQLDNEKK